jgi:hypothetical protein
LNGGWVLSQTDVNLLHTKATSIEGPEILLAQSRDVSGWPTWRGNSLSRQYYQGAASVPGRTANVHIIVGTLDHNTPIGQSNWIRHQYGSNVISKLYIVPYATHGVVTQYFTELGRDCAAIFVGELLRLNNSADPGTCLSNGVPPPDWDGVSSSTQSTSLNYFGTTDLWNVGLIPVQGPSPSPGPLGAPIFPPTAAPTPCTCPSCECSNDDSVLDATLGLVATIFVMIVGLYVVFFIQRVQPLHKQEDTKANL